MLHVCFDDSDTLSSNEPYVSFAGWIADIDSWHAFQREWRCHINGRRIRSLHLHEYMRTHQLGDKDTGQFLLESAQIINKHVFAGIACAVDCNAFHAVKQIEQDYRDPKRFCFQALIELLLHTFIEIEEQYGLGRGFPFGILFDDHEKYSMECYRLFKYVQKRNPEWRERIGSIAFANDELYLPLQAADFLAWICSKRYREPDNHAWDGIDATLRAQRRCPNAFYGQAELTELAKKVTLSKS